MHKAGHTGKAEYSPSKGLMANSQIREDKTNPKAKQGRYEDTSMAHVAPGEMIVPAPVLKNNPALKTAIMQDIAKYGVDPSKFMMDGQPTINPETGLPEFGWFSKIFKSAKKIFKVAAPIIAPIVLGPAGLGLSGLALGAASAGVGAAAGALDGGGVKGALIGGVTGGLAGGGANYLAGAAGLTGTAAKVASGALTGAAAGSQFGAKGALLGAVGGGLVGGIKGGALGQPAGTSLDKISGVAGAQGPTQGSGLIGTATRAAPGIVSSAGSSPLKYANLATSALKLLPSSGSVGIGRDNQKEEEPQGITVHKNGQNIEDRQTIGGEEQDKEPQVDEVSQQPAQVGNTIQGSAYRGSRYRNF